MPRNARIGSVDQEHPATPVPLLETVLAADVERATLLANLETAEPEDLGDIYTRLIEIDADRAPSRAAEILAGLGFSNADLARPMAEFSGGYRMRLNLATASSGSQRRIVVVQTSAGHLAGFIADRVADVIRYRARDLKNGILRGIGRARRVVDIDRVVEEDDLMRLWSVS